MNKIAFVGGGSFGTALAVLLAKKGNDISIYARDINVVNDINNNKKNSRYIESLVIPNKISASTNIGNVVEDAKFVVLAVPSHAIRKSAKMIKEYINKDAIIISIAKGIEEGSDKRLSVVIEEELDNEVVVLSGPSHAEEVAAEIPTTIVISCRSNRTSKIVQDLFMTENFRVYTNEDLIGVEIGGAVKNIIALAAGIADGIGYGDNTKAALMTRGMKEIARVGIALGGKAETFYGLTGMGDLIVTCTSMHSRNRRAGILIGNGYSKDKALDEIGMVVEGVKACRAFYELKEKIHVSMPITDSLYKVLFENKSPVDAVKELMSRDKKSENW